MPQPVRKAVLPVARHGHAGSCLRARLCPRRCLPVVDKPLIQYAVEEAQAAGIEQFIFVTGRGEAAIADHFGADEALDAHLAARHDETARALVAGAVLPPRRRCVRTTGGGAGPRPCRPLRARAGRGRALRGAASRRSCSWAIRPVSRNSSRSTHGREAALWRSPKYRRPRPAATALPRSRPTTGAPSRSPAWWKSRRRPKRPPGSRSSAATSCSRRSSLGSPRSHPAQAARSS